MIHIEFRIWDSEINREIVLKRYVAGTAIGQQEGPAEVLHAVENEIKRATETLVEGWRQALHDG